LQSHDLDEEGTSSLASELRSVIGKLKRRLREQANLGDLTWSQLLVLKRLERDGPATVSTLARAERMRPQSMSANVSALEAAGLVTGGPDPKDGRQTILASPPPAENRSRPPGRPGKTGYSAPSGSIWHRTSKHNSRAL
jgi:DNA-binding transcriptional ArsR family regulator